MTGTMVRKLAAKLRRASCARQRRVLSALLALVVGAGLCIPANGKAPPQTEETADEFLIVDCLLPGQLRKLGQRMNYLSPRRPVKTAASECEIRGGEYVAFDRADYSTALKIWLPQAKEGDPVAQAYVGEIYEKGLGLEPDYEFAAYWYQQAVKQGNSRAQINLGHLYELGLGVERDPRAALNLYRKASGVEDDQLLFASSLVSSHVTVEQHASVQSELAEEKAHSGDLEAQLVSLERDRKQEQAALAQTEKQLESTAQQLAAATSNAAANMPRTATPTARESSMAAKLDALEREHRELERQAAQLDAQNKSLEAKHTAVVSKLTAREKAQLADQQELSRLRQQMQQSKRQLQHSEQELSELEAALAQQKTSESASSDHMARLQSQLDAKNRELADARQQYSALEATNLQREQQLKSVSEEASEKSRQVSDTQQKYEQEKSRLANQQARGKQQLQKANHQLLLARAALQMERAKASKELANQSAAQRAEIIQQQTRLGELSAELEKQSSQARRERKKVEQLEARSAAYSDGKQAALEGEQQLVALAAPQIEIIEPPVVLVRSMPTVKLLSKDDERQIVGKVMAPAGIVSLSVNGKPVSLASNNLFRASVPIDISPKPVNVVVVDKQGRRAAVTFTFVDESPDAAQANQQAAAIPAPVRSAKKANYKLGDYYALVIGNNDYQQFSTLVTAVNDATETDRVLREKYNFKTRLLLNADRYAILSALNEMRETLKADDNLLIYYAGHGVMDEANGRGYWLPVDADVNNNANWISNTAITDILNVIDAKHILVVADSCFSGTLTQTPLARTQVDVPSDVRAEWIEVMAETRARITLTSGGLEPVLDGGGGDHSLFAKAFLATLRSNDTVLEGYSLYYQVLDRMGATPQSGAQQSPQYAPIHLAGHESGEFFFSPI